MTKTAYKVYCQECGDSYVEFMVDVKPLKALARSISEVTNLIHRGHSYGIEDIEISNSEMWDK